MMNLFPIIGILLICGASVLSAADWKQSVITLDIPGPANEEDSAGGIVVADVNGDGKPDFLVTCTGHLAVYDNSGSKLWIHKTGIVVGGQSESQGLPGHHGPGVGVGDVDADGAAEVIYLTKDGVLHVVDGKSGREEKSARPPVPKGAERWELAMVASLRRSGEADRDLLLQATNKSGYRTGRYLAAYAYEALIAGEAPIWTTDKFKSCAHNGARLADLDGDERDEVLGAEILSHKGEKIIEARAFSGHIDSVFVADVNPRISGPEVVMLEEGSNYVQVLSVKAPLWRMTYKNQEPQNAAIGYFKPGSSEVFIWCRSRFNEHQRPFVFDSKGKMVFEYEMDDVAPKDWTPRGVEVIHTIHWSGEKHQLACAKERHRSGDVCVFEPLTGKFVLRIPEKADRLYVADATGDWREEIVVLNGNELRVYSNTAINPRPNQERLWDDRNYRRLKQCYNYYSP